MAFKIERRDPVDPGRRQQSFLHLNFTRDADEQLTARMRACANDSGITLTELVRQMVCHCLEEAGY